MTNKKGVTLIVLGITVLVLTIIAGAAIINITGLMGKTKLAKFAEEVEMIEDKIKEYYITTGSLPIKSGMEYTANQLVKLNTQGYSSKLEKEISKNKDNNSIFYLIDYNAMNVKISERGVNNTQDDIYVVSSDTNTVYYVKGVKIEKEVYFSLAYIADTTKIN